MEIQKNKILLINLPVANSIKEDAYDELVKNFGFNPSFSLLTLGTMLELNGYEPVLLDFCYQNFTASELISTIKASNPVFIGISAFTENMHLAIKTAKVIKSQFRDIRIVAGGPHPTLMPDEIINSEYIDFVIRKEGEATLVELAEAISSNEEAISYDEITGLIYKRNGIVKKNKLRPVISDLDIMPILKRELLDINKYSGLINILTSRGCPGSCVYCAAKVLSGSSYRARNIENVFLEIVLVKVLLKGRLTRIHIMDDTFTAIPQRVEKFVELLLKYDHKIIWRCQSRVDVMTEDLLDIIAKGNCKEILYGIESGSQVVLEKIRKNINIEYAKKIIGATYKRNMLPVISFILGHFCDTKETMEETYMFIKEVYEKYKPDIHLNFNTPYPGTWQYITREKLGMKLTTNKYKLFNGCTPIVETDNFTVNDQREIYFKAFKYCWHALVLLSMKKKC